MNDGDPLTGKEIADLFGRWLPRPLPSCALAVSGGSDSTALLILFADWLEQIGDNPARHAVVTVDHGLRTESAAEVRAVAAQAVALGFRHATLRWDGPKPQTGVQAAARVARYSLIGAHMQAERLVCLLTGHTRDDQAETLLMRLARGSGLDGLAGMAPRGSLRDLGVGGLASDAEPDIVRPLLDVSRTRLRATLAVRSIMWIEDPSNSSPEFERSRIREARGQLDALGLTNRMLALSATRLLRARRALEGAVNRFCSTQAGAVTVHPSGYITIDHHSLRSIEEEIAVRVLGRAIAAAGGSRERVPLAKLETIVTAIRRTSSGEATWTLSRALIAVRGNVLMLEREPGREPFPILTLRPGMQACWDGRFEIGFAATPTGGPFEVRALGKAEARRLQTEGAYAVEVPLRVASFSPGIWHDGRLVAAPALGIGRDPGDGRLFTIRFLGADVILGR